MLIPIVIAAPPSIDSIELNDATIADNSIDLTAGNLTIISCFGTASDIDADIDTITGIIYSQNSNYDAEENESNHYSNLSCDFTAGDYNCSFDVQYYAEPNEWTCNITVNDTTKQNDSDTDTANITQMIGINIPGVFAVSFGEMDRLTNNSNRNITFENVGNVEIDINIDAWQINGDQDSPNSMNCSMGNIAIGMVRASLTKGLYGTYTPFQMLGYQFFNANLKKQVSGSIPTNTTIFIGLEIPQDIAGVCEGVISLQGV